jgi:C-terminal processing protease CtpA/Prc
MTGFLLPLTFMLVVLLTAPSSPAPQAAPVRPELLGLLDFESDHSGGVPKGWNGYSGKIVILVDEISQSQSEYTAMAFRSAPNAIVVGSTTAGADGNVSRVALPGGLESMISGIGVFYPDKKPTQRIGIVPDVVARPTIEGIRGGRDEVLEAALRHILGPGTPAAEIERMARR